jgi:hypothetical protein
MHSRTAWNDYFPSVTTYNLNSQTYTSRQALSNSYVYASNCVFSGITTSARGSAFHLTSTTYFLVESTSFFSCKTSYYYGGAIYFENSGGQCVLNKICGYDSSTNGAYYLFAHIYVNNAITSKNYVNYSSITGCGFDYPSVWYVLYLGYGKNDCQSFNLSNNKCYGRFIYCDPVSDSNSVTCSLTYSTFADNIATDSSCLYFNTRGAKYEIKSCNIIRNTQSSLSSGGTIFTYGITTIYDSCILKNNADYYFYQGSSYTITLTNCTVDRTTNNGYLTTRNTVTKNFILGLNHISTRNCHSEYDSVGTLIPTIQTSQKRIRWYTCRHHNLLRDFVSWVSFILLDASG